MKKLLNILKWGVVALVAIIVAAWVSYVLTRNRLINDQDECAALAYQRVPTTNVDEPALRKVFAECMAARHWSEGLMFGDWPLGRHAWKE